MKHRIKKTLTALTFFSISTFCAAAQQEHVTSKSTQTGAVLNPIATYLANGQTATTTMATVDEIATLIKTDACQANSECLFLGESSLGKLLSQLPSRDEKTILTAENHFRNALRLKPDDSATLLSMRALLRNQQREDEAARFYLDAASSSLDVTKRTEYLLTAGDLTLPVDPIMALKIYKQTCSSNINCNEPRMRILKALGELPADKRDRQIGRLVVEWSNDAESMLRLRERQAKLLSSSGKSFISELELADIFNDWLVYSAISGKFSAEKLNTFSAVLEGAYYNAAVDARPLKKAVRELTRFTKTGYTGGLYAYVGSKALYRHAVSYIILYWATKDESVSKSASQISYTLERAIYKYSPTVAEYVNEPDLYARNIIRFKICKALFSLLAEHPELDKNDRRKTKLLNSLYSEEKAVADLKSTANTTKYHALLGRAYLLNPSLQNDALNRSAVYHFFKAVKSAGNEADGDLLHDWAKACDLELHSTYCAIDHGEASVTAIYTKTAEQYFREKNPASAAKIISVLKNSTNQPREQHNIRMLELILKLYNIASDNTLPRKDNTTSKIVATLRSPELFSVDQAFISEQLIQLGF